MVVCIDMPMHRCSSGRTGGRALCSLSCGAFGRGYSAVYAQPKVVLLPRGVVVVFVHLPRRLSFATSVVCFGFHLGI